VDHPPVGARPHYSVPGQERVIDARRCCYAWGSEIGGDKLLNANRKTEPDRSLTVTARLVSAWQHCVPSPENGSDSKTELLASAERMIEISVTQLDGILRRLERTRTIIDDARQRISDAERLLAHSSAERSGQ
jgi:hypothetical protein